jgi:hypothetical protein
MDKEAIMKAKKIYFDLRLGGITLNPVIALSNFLMLAYLTINESIPFWLFVPLFIGGVFLLYSFVGNKFRKIQYETDSNLIYEKQTENAKTNYIIICALMDNDNIATSTREILKDRADYLQRIIDKKL